MRLESIVQLSLSLLAEDCTARRLAPRSQRMLLDAAKGFLRWTSQRSSPDPRTLTKKDLVSFHAWLTRQASKRTGAALAPGTVAARFRAVAYLYSCLYRSGLVAENPAQGLFLGAKGKAFYTRRPLTRSEITRFLESIDPGTANRKKNHHSPLATVETKFRLDPLAPSTYLPGYCLPYYMLEPSQYGSHNARMRQGRCKKT